MSSPERVWLTTREAANILGSDPTQVRRWLNQGLLTGRKRSSGDLLVAADGVYHLRATRAAGSGGAK